MTQPTIEANYGSVDCNSYYPGHNVHWIPVLRKWVDEPRLPMTIKHIEGNEFEITSGDITQRLFNHDPRAVISAIKNNDQSCFKKVGNTGAITIDTPTGHGWIYFSTDSFMDCQVPRPTYYERYKDIDKEIARHEERLKTVTTDWDIQTTTRFIERAKHIKHLQLTNAHERLKSVSGYSDVCSCGLNLTNIRRIDEAVGHITY